MTNSSVNVSHFQHVQHCSSQHCKSHQNDSTARARGCRVFPVRCQTSVSHRERCEQNQPSWLIGCVLNPEICSTCDVGWDFKRSGMQRRNKLPSTNYATGVSLCITMTTLVRTAYREATGNNMTVCKRKQALPPPVVRLSNRVANVVGEARWWFNNWPVFWAVGVLALVIGSSCWFAFSRFISSRHEGNIPQMMSRIQKHKYRENAVRTNTPREHEQKVYMRTAKF